MARLSTDLRQLHTRLDDWINGRTVFEASDFLAFGRDLKICVARACMLELGVDTSAIDAGAPHDVLVAGNVVAFPAERVRRVLAEEIVTP